MDYFKVMQGITRKHAKETEDKMAEHRSYGEYRNAVINAVYTRTPADRDWETLK